MNEYLKSSLGTSMDSIKEMLSDFDGYFSNSGTKIGSNIEVEESLTFKEAIDGVELEVLYVRNELCNSCNGKKYIDNKDIKFCDICNGKGYLLKDNSNIEEPCDDCMMEGKIIIKHCKTCHGLGTELKQKNLKVDIPSGVWNGNLIRVVNQGNCGDNDEKNGDLLIKLSVEEDNYFKREEGNIVTDAYIYYSQAKIGDKITIKTIDDELETIEIPKNCQNGYIIKLKTRISNVNHLVRINVVNDVLSSPEEEELYAKLNEINKKKNEYSVLEKKNKGEKLKLTEYFKTWNI